MELMEIALRSHEARLKRKEHPQPFVEDVEDTTSMRDKAFPFPAD